jgi:hypothetical protein
MRRGGYAFMLVIFAIGAAAAAAVVFATRLSVTQNARKAERVRTQALWLGRSACETKLTSSRRIRTELGEAALSRSGSAVTVELSGGVATVDCTSHEEQYSVN